MVSDKSRKIDKNLEIRNRLLHRIERGEWKTGDKLPGARLLAKEVGCCFTHLQTVIESLVQQGILLSIPRSGTYVRENWEKRLIQKSFRPYGNTAIFPIDDLKPLFSAVPALWITARSERAVFELQVSHYLLGHHSEYMDLMPMFNRLCKDRSLFFTPLLEAFRINGKLCGIPLLFSPRIIVCNRRMFEENGVPLPRRGWSWEAFMECIGQLRRRLPGERTFHFESSLYIFFSVAARFGGKILDPAAPGTVSLDSPEMMRALGCFLELRDLLGPFRNRACNYEAAMWMTTRQELHRQIPQSVRQELVGVELPLPQDGFDVNVPGVELLCIRSECADLELAEQLIAAALSEECQNHIGGQKSGIPFRNSSAAASLDPKVSTDALFLREMCKPPALYSSVSADIYNIVSRSVLLINSRPRPEAMTMMRDLASTIRFLLRIAE